MPQGCRMPESMDQRIKIPSAEPIWNGYGLVGFYFLPEVIVDGIHIIPKILVNFAVI